MRIKRIRFISLFLLSLAWMMFLFVDSYSSRSIAANRAATAKPPLPASLAKHYPPVANHEVFYEFMHDMERTLGAAEVNLREGDMDNALEAYKAFQTKYTNIATLVPEWKHYLDIEVFDVISTALSSGDQGAVMAGFQRLGASCDRCHHDNMARVSLLYRWQRMGEMVVDDPVTGNELPFKLFKHELGYNFNGIGVDLMEGQISAAQNHFTEFKQRFDALADTCAECHETERRYYVDPEIQGTVADLGKQLQSEQPDINRIMGDIQSIGDGSCNKCHLVHVPGSYAPYFLETE